MKNVMSMSEFKQEIKKCMEVFVDKYVQILYDDKEYDGKIEDIFTPADKGIPGFIVRGHDEHGAEQYKHIKITRINNIIDREGCGPQGLLKTVIKRGEEKLYGVETRNGFTNYKEFSLDGKNNSVFNASKQCQFYSSKEDVEAMIANTKEKLKAEEKENTARKERLNKFCEVNFYSKPNMRDDELEVHKENLASVEKEINDKLKDMKGFAGIDFNSNYDGNIYIRGFHSEIVGYAYGNYITLLSNFENKQEAIENFVEMWRDNDTNEKVEQYKKFIEAGEKYGWD